MDSVMPMRSRSAGGMSEWVMVPGCSASDSVPPRLTASLTSFREFNSRNASASLPTTSKEIMEPGPTHCLWKVS